MFRPIDAGADALRIFNIDWPVPTRSACPDQYGFASSSRAANAANLTLEDPAFNTRSRRAAVRSAEGRAPGPFFVCAELTEGMRNQNGRDLICRAPVRSVPGEFVFALGSALHRLLGMRPDGNRSQGE